jgi:hypothetical protein
MISMHILPKRTLTSAWGAIGKTDTGVLRKPFVETRRGAQAWTAQSGIGISANLTMGALS